MIPKNMVIDLSVTKDQDLHEYISVDHLKEWIEKEKHHDPYMGYQCGVNAILKDLLKFID